MNKEKKNEYQRRYRETHREEKRAYNKKWARENKERVKEYRKKRYEENPEYYIAKKREYYYANKEKVLTSQRKYRQNNKEKVNKMFHDYRKRKAIEFQAQGQMYCYLPKTERQNKMVACLCKKTSLSEVECRALLEENNWNIKALLPVKIKRSKRGRPRKDES